MQNKKSMISWIVSDVMIHFYYEIIENKFKYHSKRKNDNVVE